MPLYPLSREWEKMEVSLNSRPLIYEHDENDTEEALTSISFPNFRKLATVFTDPKINN